MASIQSEESIAAHDAIRERFMYHPADTEERRNTHAWIRQQFEGLAHVIESGLPGCREKSLAHTALQEAAMWCNAAAAIHLPHAEPEIEAT